MRQGRGCQQIGNKCAAHRYSCRPAVPCWCPRRRWARRTATGWRRRNSSRISRCRTSLPPRCRRALQQREGAVRARRRGASGGGAVRATRGASAADGVGGLAPAGGPAPWLPQSHTVTLELAARTTPAVGGLMTSSTRAQRCLQRARVPRPLSKAELMLVRRAPAGGCGCRMALQQLQLPPAPPYKV